ncbi:MAG: formate/nitrite transporter family protein [Saprospiraceae bacterium]|nr:formate/nitrite transporter family protein [Saprospiraceae bacterium]
MNEIYGFDSYSPTEIAKKIEEIGVKKVRLPLLSMVMLGILAGAFISLGAMYYTMIASDPELSIATRRILGGLAFSTGLILVVIAGAELFTGNNLIAMAWADNKISTAEVLQNWLVVCLSNLAGAMIMAFLIYNSGHLELEGGIIKEQYLKIATLKCELPMINAFFAGILCNIFVCLAIWMSFSGRSVIDKIIAIIFPISAFVALGFEHSIANFYFIILGMLIQTQDGLSIDESSIGIVGFFHNTIPVILGNLIGGSVLVALVYYVIYKKNN